MNVKRLSIENFRNIQKLDIEPCENVNVIYGQNAQGKTNITEALWLCTGCRSFRGAKDKELLRFGADRGKIKIEFYGSGREQTEEILIGDKREIILNRIPCSSPSKAIGEFNAVVFSPVHLSLIKQGPAERRKFLDIAISQLKPQYAAYLTKYNRAVTQRNALLKNSIYAVDENMLEIFDDAVAAYGSKIALYRLTYIEKLIGEVRSIYEGLSSGREKIDLIYIQTEKNENITDKNEFLRMLKKMREKDIATGTTNFGSHRDDLEIRINGISARRYGSQGQQRSCALSMKLGEAAMMENVTGQQPVALLDDVMSELDKDRQDYILNHIKSRQVFITCCEKETVQKLKNGKSFHIVNGTLTGEE